MKLVGCLKYFHVAEVVAVVVAIGDIYALLIKVTAMNITYVHTMYIFYYVLFLLNVTAFGGEGGQ